MSDYFGIWTLEAKANQIDDIGGEGVRWFIHDGGDGAGGSDSWDLIMKPQLRHSMKDGEESEETGAVGTYNDAMATERLS